MTAFAARVLASLVTDKRFWKFIGAILIILALVITAVGTSCNAHNLQHYATVQVASDFAPLVASVNADIENGQELNTQLLYAAYITLFDNQQYANKGDVRSRLIKCFYTESTKKIALTDADGNPVVDEQGNKTYTSKKVAVPVTDSARIFVNIEKAFSITIDETKQKYILNLSAIFIDYSSDSFSDKVAAYQPSINKYCTQYGISEYTALISAIMQTESGGTGSDPMQCSESPNNKKYPQIHNGITDSDYSISIGVQYFESCLRAAKCKSPQDIPAISLALQGYNFGGGYITWALAKGGYTQANAAMFSESQAKKLGWDSYGDVNYVSHVLRYYSAVGADNQTGGVLGYPIQPGKYTLSSPYGLRPDPTTGKAKFHKGIDMAAPLSTPVHASEGGIVIYAQFGTIPYTGYGNIVVIRHSSSFVSMYGHCSKLLVSSGQIVKKGAVIALVGSTGDSTGNHCHFEVRENDKSVDPMAYLK
jgi:hypothetical protein